MKNLSVTTFIHILFSVAILILIATFLLFLSWDKDRHKIEEYKHYQLISITFLSKLQLNPGKEDLDSLYKDLRVKPLSRKKAIEIKKQIETEGETVFTGGSSIGKAILKIDGAKSGICKMLDLESVPIRMPRFISESACSISVANLNIKKAFDELAKRVQYVLNTTMAKRKNILETKAAMVVGRLLAAGHHNRHRNDVRLDGRGCALF